MIKADSLSKSYGNVRALHEASFTIAKGEISGILGPNGAGKTTLFKILTGLITPDSGSFSITSDKRKKIGAIIENPALYEYLSAHKNLQVLAKMQGLKLSKDQVNEQLTLVGLPTDRHDPVRNFSLGMKQRLGIATALLNNPDALILDEPFLGLDPLGMQKLRELIIRLAKERNLSVLVSSHQLEELSKVCQNLYLMQNGEITSSGSTQEILSKAAFQYRIQGINLSQSETLKSLKATITSNTAWVTVARNDVSALVQQLVNEGVEILEVQPETNLNELYAQV
ncbi:ABC transporter ATP-binding protein [Roseivirga pacifica]|uniref:ABC transporter ATP-binding protein n=1 Tax=Roseivirga pacifica TaxID=1267423 RepID=UPI003BAF3650